MKFTLAFVTSILLVGASAVSATSGTASWDDAYGTGSNSLNIFACSDGENGLVSQYPTLANIPGFPNVGAAPTIAGWNSENCGACFQLTWTSSKGKTNTIYIIGVDTSRSTGNFVLSKAALNTLTGGRADTSGRVPVSWTQLDSDDKCKGK